MKLLTTTFLIVITLCFVGCDECKFKQEPLVDMGHGWYVAESLANKIKAMKPGDSIVTQSRATIVYKKPDSFIWYPQPDGEVYIWPTQSRYRIDTSYNDIEADKIVDSFPPNAREFIIDNVDGDYIFGDKIINNKK